MESQLNQNWIWFNREKKSKRFEYFHHNVLFFLQMFILLYVAVVIQPLFSHQLFLYVPNRHTKISLHWEWKREERKNKIKWTTATSHQTAAERSQILNKRFCIVSCVLLLALVGMGMYVKKTGLEVYHT